MLKCPSGIRNFKKKKNSDLSSSERRKTCLYGVTSFFFFPCFTFRLYLILSVVESPTKYFYDNNATFFKNPIEKTSK